MFLNAFLRPAPSLMMSLCNNCCQTFQIFREASKSKVAACSIILLKKKCLIFLNRELLWYRQDIFIQHRCVTPLYDNFSIQLFLAFIIKLQFIRLMPRFLYLYLSFYITIFAVLFVVIYPFFILRPTTNPATSATATERTILR